MAVIQLKGHTANEIIDIVHSMRTMGLVQGQDFDFKFVPANSDPITGHIKTERYTEFELYDEKWATLFSLRWS
jgi:hypothetical protein